MIYLHSLLFAIAAAPDIQCSGQELSLTAGRDEAGWIVEERWEELRKLGQAGGWLVTHDQVCLHLYSCS